MRACVFGVLNMDEEWGPWIEHDGSGCPCVGEFTHVVYVDLVEEKGISKGGESWYWCDVSDTNGWSHDGIYYYTPITHYRIRKPKGMAILNAILREVERTPELV